MMWCTSSQLHWLASSQPKTSSSKQTRSRHQLHRRVRNIAFCVGKASTMRLITHNMLVCNKKGVENGFPLRIDATEVQVIESEFNADFIRKMLTKIDWAAFLAGAKALNVAEGLPEHYNAEQHANDEGLLRKVHHALMDVHVKKGNLVCPESGREFPVLDGIPNMLLREDEV